MDAFLFQAEALRLEKLMYHVSYSMLRNSDDCADAVQEALTRAWQKRETLKSMDSFKPWLMRILINQCKDMLRRRKRWSLFSMEQAAEETADATPERPPLAEAMDRLKPEYRLVIVLHYLEGFSVREIAGATGLPEGTVKTRLKTGREKLGALLRDEGEGDPV